MKKLLAAVMVVIAGSSYAADFSALQSVKAGEIAAAESIAAPAARAQVLQLNKLDSKTLAGIIQSCQFPGASVQALAAGLTEKDSTLCAAAWEGDAAKTAELINSGADMNAVCGSGWSVLYTAVSQSHFEVVERLARLGARINIKNTNGAVPLHGAAYSSGPGMVLLLLDKGALPDAADDAGRTPLHMAAAHDMVENAAILLKRGATPGPKDLKGVTPLQIAIRKGYEEMASLLKYFGATIDRMQAPPGRRNA